MKHERVLTVTKSTAMTVRSRASFSVTTIRHYQKQRCSNNCNNLLPLRPNFLQQPYKPREKADGADTLDGNGISHTTKGEEQQPQNERQDNPLSLHIIRIYKLHPI